MAAAIDLTEYASSSIEEKIEMLFKFFDVDEDGWLVSVLDRQLTVIFRSRFCAEPF
jgi:Ca2+-binding EF-hand superfamily protein